MAERELRKGEMILFTLKGYPILNPLLSVINTNLSQMKGFLVEFGMTPASRTRVKGIPPAEKANEFDQI